MRDVERTHAEMPGAEADASEVHSAADVHGADMADATVAAAPTVAAATVAAAASAQFRRRDCKGCRNRRDKSDFAKHVLLRVSPLAPHIAAMLVNHG
jgi:hypothetical protein